MQNVSSFGGSTWAAFNIKFCFPFLSHSSSTFLGYLSTGHTLKDLDFSVFLSHSSSHSSSSSCVITTHRHSKEFKFIFFFLPSFVHSFFARDDELFWFSFLFVIVDEISFQHTDSLLSIPPFNIFFLLVDEFCPLPRWQILSRSGTWKNACFVSCRITRSFLFFFQEQRKGCGEMMILDGVASTLDKKKHTKKWLWRIIRPRLPLPAFTSQCLFVALFVLFCFPFFFKYLWDLGLKKYRKVRASKTLSALNGSLLTSLSSDDDANTSFKITVFALMQKNEKGRLHLSLPHHKPTSS